MYSIIYRLKSTFGLVFLLVILAWPSTLAYGLSPSYTSSPHCTVDFSKTPNAKTVRFSDEFDNDLAYAAERFLPEYNWLWLKAQCYQESLLVPTAVSGAGAMGLCQFMPRTWEHVSKTLNLNASPFNARANALAAGYYMGTLGRQWSSPRCPIERLYLMQAAYNAGLGNVLKAQKKCNGVLLWHEIEPCLGFNETKTYIIRIQRWFNELAN